MQKERVIEMPMHLGFAMLTEMHSDFVRQKEIAMH
jgi:hypothetical protein